MKTMLVCVLILAAFCAAQNPQQPPADPNSPRGMVQQARRFINDGKFDDAIALCVQALQQEPKLAEAYMAGGTALDLKGNYAEARRHFQHAIDVATDDRQKAQAQRSMAVSYFFERNARGAEQAEKPLIDSYIAKKDFVSAADVSNELARLLLESNDYDGALKYYETGYESSTKASLKPEEHALWEWRWHNAQARVAARQGHKAEAQKHVDAAKAALDKVSEQDKKAQAQYWPYLTGYVDFYGGDYAKAITELQDASAKANQRDPFILALLAQAYEKTGKSADAMELYKKILTMNIHNPTGAYARPIAQKKLGSS